MKLSKEVRRGFVEGVVIRMDPDDVANCLIISLNELIGLEGGHGKKKIKKR